MEKSTIIDEFTALVYAPDGRRVRARVSVCCEARPCALEEPVFCEAALGGALTGIYSGGPSAPEACARLFRAEGVWRLRGDAPAGLAVRAFAGERAVVRGIYALAGQRRPCFVRESRAIWDGLIELWRARGLSLQLICEGERAVAYALLGGPAEDGRYGQLHEFAALPGSGVALDGALALLHAAGACPREVRICASEMEVSVGSGDA